VWHGRWEPSRYLTNKVNFDFVAILPSRSLLICILQAVSDQPLGSPRSCAKSVVLYSAIILRALTSAGVSIVACQYDELNNIRELAACVFTWLSMNL
jgi:hypothetical protein